MGAVRQREAECKIADLGQTGSELDLEYERYVDKAFGSLPDEAREGLRGLVDVASGYVPPAAVLGSSYRVSSGGTGCAF
jgi:hypothetical protein